jgi:two-component system, chemotaxis family, chemotaxis protein CheY
MFDLKIQILVVDDMLTMRKTVIRILKEIGFSNFVEADNGNAAFTALENNPEIKLVVSDWNMPSCTGIDFLKKVRSDERFSKMPFLMVTAEGEQKQIAEAIRSGVSNYLVKPFSADQLKEKIGSIHHKIVSQT